MARLSETYIHHLLEENNVPGVSIAQVESGKLTWCRAFGAKDSIIRNPVDVHTVFECASLAKTLFTYAVLKYFKKENLSIDKPLVDYYPHPYTEWGFSTDNSDLKMVTVRHILSHTSGFNNWDRLEGLHAGKLKFVPEQRFAYSGEAVYYSALSPSQRA